MGVRGIHLRRVDGEGIDKPLATLPGDVDPKDAVEPAQIGAELRAFRSFK